LQIPIELVLGPSGAVVVLFLWVLDLRRQNAALTDRLNRIVDALEVALKDSKK